MLMVTTSIRRAAAKRLRANTTPHERTLWRALKELPIEGTHFRRQAPIGPYVVDFFCPARRLLSNWMAVITMTMRLRSEIVRGRRGSSRRDIVLFASGI